MKRAIFILGMHRSGTSAMARVVNLLGAELGSHLMAAADDNQKGFFEHEDIVIIHERLLTELGMSWHDGVPLPDGWIDSDAALKAKTDIAKIIDRDFTNSELWAVKDPRQCRLMPLWIPLLEERNIQPHFIVAYRQPLEVAASLAKRDNMAQEPALLCWLSYTLEAILAAIKYPYSILSYNELMNDWRSAMGRVGKELKISWPTDINTADGEINSFLSPNLHHHKNTATDSLPKNIENCLKLLEKPNTRTVNRLYKEWRESCAAFAPLLHEARLTEQKLLTEINELKKEQAAHLHRAKDLNKQMANLKDIVEKERQKITTSEEIIKAERQKSEQLEQTLGSIYTSSSWKITEPLRKASTVLGRKKLANQDDTN